MSLSCLECPKRENCSELCPRAEKYADQDYKSQRETPQDGREIAKDLPDLFNIPDLDRHKMRFFKSKVTLADLQVSYSGEVKISYLTKRQNKILSLYCNKVPRWQIARNLKIDKSKVSNELYRAKQKIKLFHSKSRREKT